VDRHDRNLQREQLDQRRADRLDDCRHSDDSGKVRITFDEVKREEGENVVL